MATQGTPIVGAAILGLIIVACAVLVGLDKLDADLFMGVVIGPTVGLVGGYVAGTKGVQQGAQAVVNPPPDA